MGHAEAVIYYVSSPGGLCLELTEEQWAYVQLHPGIEFSYLRLNGNNDVVLEWTTEMAFQRGNRGFAAWNAGVPCEYQLYVTRLRRSGLVKCIYSRSAEERPRGGDSPATGGALDGDLLPGWRELQEQATTTGAAHDTDTTELLGDAPHAVHPADWLMATEEVHHRQAHWWRVWKAALLLWLSIQPDGREAADRFSAVGMPYVDVVVGNTGEVFPSQRTLATAVAHALNGGRDEVPAARLFNFQVLKDPNWPLLLREARDCTTIEAEKLFYSVLLSSTPAQCKNLARLGAAAITFPPPAGAPAAEAVMDADDEEDEELRPGPYSRSMQLPGGEASVEQPAQASPFSPDNMEVDYYHYYHGKKLPPLFEGAVPMREDMDVD